MSGQAVALTPELITGGTAIVVGLITGWFARSAGVRQAEATRESARKTLDEQRALRVLDSRRQTYARLIETAETVVQARMRGEDGEHHRTALRGALSVVELEGPDDVAAAARDLVAHLGTEGFSSLEDIERARRTFIDTARTALARL